MLSPRTSNNQDNRLDQQLAQNQHQSQFQHPYQPHFPLSTQGLFQGTNPPGYLSTKTNGAIGNRDLANTAGKLPFSSFGLDSALSMNREQYHSSKLAENRQNLSSSVLSTADLQFSGYILNGFQNTNRSPFSYSPAASLPMTESGGNGTAGPHSSRLLETLGMPGSNSVSGAVAGCRTNSSLSPAYRQAMGSSGFPTTESSQLAGYSTYASLLNKANLMFENNLDSMMIDWTLEERECRRRLVQFWRRHENNNIFCTFKAVAAADRVPNSIVVSCIYWEEKNDFFITSVDCIHLLESLIAVRFTVEEKNRIRRNLEGFRPLTVSKCKSDSVDFFKLIMSFPNPKPRNIEKDVKVFPWRILPLALKKIIGKYTASFSSTASITLDTYPTPRVASYSQLVGIPPPSSTTGIPGYSLTTPMSDVLGSSSASAAIVAAAAAAAGFMVLQNGQIQFGFAGMAAEHPVSPTDAASVQSASSSLLDKLTSDYELAFAEIAASPQPQKAQQLVARSQSVKKPTPRTPYSVDRSDRYRSGGGGNGSGGADGNSPTSASMSSYAMTMLADGGDRQGKRKASPSIPLILEQQCHDINFGMDSTVSSSLSSSMLMSGISAGNSVTNPTLSSVNKVFRDAGNSVDNFAPLYSMLDKALGGTGVDSSCNSSSSGDTVFKSDSPDANSATRSSATPILLDPRAGSTDMFKFDIGGDLCSSDFSFLANLISASSNQNTGTDCSPESKSGMVSCGEMPFMTEQDAEQIRCSDIFALMESSCQEMEPGRSNHE
ncbi:hypothetical protein LPJ53_001089 [Coemansia erecta]|uniref:DUF7082 domain-containing protein n=1 Tax=Coemansia erecta TaxID=147472 RepID=A0A9W8CUG5_9FUNG|nr:hypothetical protein LPJ53_001089 [Coemansia erecta]